MSTEYSGEEREIDVRAIFGLLRRQIRLIAVCVLLVVVVTALVTFSLTPKYTAAALVQVESGQRNLLDPQAAFAGDSSDISRIESAVEIAKSDSILLQAIDDLDLVDDPEFGVSLGFRSWLTSVIRSTPLELPTGEEALHQILGNLKGALSVSRRGLTSLISIEVESVDPFRAAVIANAVASAYIQDQIDTRISAALQARDVLQRRIAIATTDVTSSEEAIDLFVFDNLDRITEETGREDIANMRAEVAAFEAERERTNALADVLAESLDSQDFDSLRQSLQSDAARALERQRTQLEAQLSGLPESAPEAVDLRAELARLDQELRRTARIELGSLRDSLAQSQGALSDLRGSIRNAALSAELPTDLLTTVYSLQQEASVARSQYQVLLSRLRDVEAQADLQLAEARIVSPALEPSGPSFPRVSLILAVATMFSLALGIGIAYLRENYVGGFVSDRQVESVLRLPTSVSVPRLRTHDDTGELALLSPADAIVTAPISQYSESVRRIGASVDQLLRSREPGSGSARGSVLMVCSAIPGEGKSTLALSLGRSYALSGKRPILIDCDLRKPSIHRHLGIQPSRGLYEFLASHGQQIKFSDIVVRDSQTLLAMAIGARGSGTPTDHLVFGTAFEHLVESAAAAFDTVILDTPPIGAVVDGLYLAKHADVIALVVRWASTSQDEVRSTMKTLFAAKRPDTPILAVLNQVEGARNRYNSRYAGYFEEGY